MPIQSVPFGPGTVTVMTTPINIEAEVLGGKITHTYEDVGESHTHMDGSQHAASRNRTDGVSLSVENDLTDAGIYYLLQQHDLETAPIVFTPNTANAASWAGTVQLSLPAEIGADEFGAYIVSQVEWAGVGKFTFTAGTAAMADEPAADSDG
jgi:hypothetical protein